MPNPPQSSNPDDLQEVTNGNRIARHLVEGFAEEYSADIWRELATAFADIPVLAAQVTHLHAELANSRLNQANLAAAALAAISAHHDGDPDPLCYLRDELHAQGYDITRGHR